MSVASVTPIQPTRDRNSRRVALKAARKQERLNATLGNARTPGQVAAVAFDELRIALAKVAATDPNGAMTKAREIHNDLLDLADQLTDGNDSPTSLAPHPTHEGSY